MKAAKQLELGITCCKESKPAQRDSYTGFGTKRACAAHVDDDWRGKKSTRATE